MATDLKIAVVGAGSFVFGSSLLVEALETLRMDRLEFALIDPNREAVEAMAAFGKGLALRNGLATVIRTYDAFDAAGALDGADVVIHSAAPQLARRYLMDCDIIERHCPGEAMLEFGGVAGISYSLRQIHLVEQLAARMKEHCSQAWLIAVANPLPRVCQAAHESGIRTVGLCSAWLEGFTFLSRIMTGAAESHPWPAARARWWMQFGGLNHFTWVDRITDTTNGTDILPELLRRLDEGASYGQSQCEAISREVRAWLLPNDHHIRDFMPVTTPTHRREFPMHGSTQERTQAFGRLRDAAEGRIPVTAAVPHPSWEHPAHVVAGLLLGHDLSFDSLNLVNDANQLPGIPPGVFVETAARSESGRLVPERFELPAAALSLCARTAQVTDLIVRAARTRSRDALRMVCQADPTIHDPGRAHAAVLHALEIHSDLIPPYA